MLLCVVRRIVHGSVSPCKPIHTSPQPKPSKYCLQRHRRLAVWSISTQPAQGFVAVTPMRWPGAGGAQVGIMALTSSRQQIEGWGAALGAPSHKSTAPAAAAAPRLQQLLPIQQAHAVQPAFPHSSPRPATGTAHAAGHGGGTRRRQPAAITRHTDGHWCTWRRHGAEHTHIPPAGRGGAHRHLQKVSLAGACRVAE